MIGTTIQPRAINWIWIQLLSLLVILSVGLFIWKGPFWVLTVSGFSMGVGLLGLGFSAAKPIGYPKKVWIVLALGIHLSLIVTAIIFKSLFLTRLPDEKLNLPLMNQVYVHPDGMYEIKGPRDWVYKTQESISEIGLNIQPQSPGQYMGASDLQIWVRELQEKPESAQEFIEKMAQTLSFSSKPTQSKKAFHFKTETVSLLNGDTGMMSILDIKKFWIPIRQVTLFGMVNGRYLCSVSVTGLKSHSTLSKVLCIGIFETIKIPAVSR